MAVFAEKVALLAALTFVLLNLAAASRYKSCSEGCCQHEFCAYGLVCYPIAKCRYGCPDGECMTHDDGDNKACLPEPPCETSKECRPGHACTKNYNLGYLTCQYDLSIGSSLCDQSHNLHNAPRDGDSWEKRSFLARWRGKAAFKPKTAGSN